MNSPKIYAPVILVCAIILLLGLPEPGRYTQPELLISGFLGGIFLRLLMGGYNG